MLRCIVQKALNCRSIGTLKGKAHRKMASTTLGGIDIAHLRNAVEKFQAAERIEYEVVTSIVGGNEVKNRGDMLVLDSSFNPPTKAHLNLILSSLRSPAAASQNASCVTSEQAEGNLPLAQYSRVLLLLAVENVDKAPRPASFADRLAMMTLFAQDLLSNIYNTQTNNSQTPPIDIGIIKHARFLDKATALRNAYPNIDEMIFLTGFDTLYRFFNPVYYGGRLEPLAPFFEGGNRIRCFYRPYTSVHQESTQWKREQERYVEEIKEGNMQAQGCLRKWGEKIELVDHGLDSLVSSTLIRDAAKTGDGAVMGKMLSDGVKMWVLEKKLYRD